MAAADAKHPEPEKEGTADPDAHPETHDGFGSVETGLVDILDFALGAVQFPFQAFGMLSRQGDTVQLEVAGGFSLLRFSDRGDEGWPPFEVRAPLGVSLFIASSSVRTRGAIFWCRTEGAALEAELEALGATRSERHHGDWALPTDAEGVEAHLRVRASRPALVVMQRRSYAAIGDAIRAQTRRADRAGGE